MTAPARKTNYHSHSQSPSFLLEGETLDLCHNHAPQIFRPIATFGSGCVAPIPQPVPEIGTETSSSAQLREYGLVLSDNLTISTVPKWLNQQPTFRFEWIGWLEIAPAHLIGILAWHQRQLSGADLDHGPENNDQPSQRAHLAALPVGDHQPNHATEQGEQHDQSAQYIRGILKYRPEHSGFLSLPVIESRTSFIPCLARAVCSLVEHQCARIFFGVFPKSVGRFA